jgi:hypothetical protein
MFSAVVVGLAVFGAYSAVKCVKDKACCCVDGIKCICGKIGMHKKESCSCNQTDTEPYDG